MRATRLLGALALALAVTACGSQSEDQSSRAPKPSEKIGAFAARLQSALTQPGCPGLNRLNIKNESGLVLPCPAANPRARRAFAGFKVVGSASYGTGGVVDYTDAEAPRGGTYVTALGPSGRWVILAAPILNERTAGTKAADHKAQDRVLATFLTAIRKGDCNAFFTNAVTMSQNMALACRRELPFYANLAAGLKAAKDAKPFWLGGNGWFQFYGLITDKPKPAYRTAIVAKSGPRATRPYLVLTTNLGPAPKK
jgi:hypothetical protein